ncbi:MAG TPA: DUF1003 domain-containing protein [Bacilli bacterium]|nr:DUF1003 domain-containing protein [Bacilli bacterium]
MERSKSKRDIVKQLLRQDLEERDEEELMELLVDNPIAVDIDKQQEEGLKFGEKVADKLSAKAGSWGFILLFSIFIIIWIMTNVILLNNRGMDPYPFILLNLFLSCIAALQAPIIMMSQNRQAKKDSLRGHNDYRVDLKSELILEELYHDVHQMIKNQNRIIAYIEKREEQNAILEKKVNKSQKKGKEI